MILQINLIWSLINFPNDKSMSKIMKGGVIQCVRPAISTSLSRDVLHAGQTEHFLFRQCTALLPGWGGPSKARTQISFTSCCQTLVSIGYPLSCVLKPGPRVSIRELSSSVFFAQTNKEDGECECVWDTCVPGELANNADSEAR